MHLPGLAQVASRVLTIHSGVLNLQSPGLSLSVYHHALLLQGSFKVGTPWR